MGANQVISERLSLKLVLRGIIVSYTITVPIFLIFSYILTYTNFPEKFISPIVFITTLVSILVAGMTATKSVKNMGWLNGGLVGIVYMAVLYIFSSLVFKDFSVDWHVVTMFFIGLLTGAIGGIIGINLKSAKKMRYKNMKK